MRGPSWCGSCIYSCLCNQTLASLLTLCVRIPLKRGVLDTTLCDEVCQWLATGWRFSPGTPVSSTNKAYLHDITEILLRVALNIIHNPLCHKNNICVSYVYSKERDKVTNTSIIEAMYILEYAIADVTEWSRALYICWVIGAVVHQRFELESRHGKERTIVS